MLPALPLQGRTVLVLEDSSVQRSQVVAALLELGAAHIREASHGIEGLEVLAQEPGLDLVLSDLEMPRMGGVRFIGELAARGYRPRIVILSAQDLPVLRAVQRMAETYGLAVLGVLAKPLEPCRLKELLQGPDPLVPPLAPAAAPAASPALSPREIRDGLRRDEFVCFFQPQVTFKGAHFKGVEALVRWRHPELGLLGPAAFLPQLEAEEELVSDLTVRILAFVASQWHAWRRRGLSLEVAVNLSARSLSEAGFADRLLQATEQLDLPAKSLVFEVTESVPVSNLGHTLATLARLRLRGCRLSIDDFGTGFATFEQLERFPFTELKLDRSIVMHLPGSEHHAIMARSILEMARDLKLRTVAEGIETLASWSALKALGCDSGQGYLVGRPMPGEQVGEWSRRERVQLRQEG